MDSSEDKRYFPRASVSSDVVIHFEEGHFPAKVVDVTVGGLACKIGTEIPVRSEVNLEISGDEKFKANRLRAEVLRCEPDPQESSNEYIVSLQLTEADDKFLMDSLALVHGKKPSRKS